MEVYHVERLPLRTPLDVTVCHALPRSTHWTSSLSRGESLAGTVWCPMDLNLFGIVTCPLDVNRFGTMSCPLDVIICRDRLTGLVPCLDLNLLSEPCRAPWTLFTLEPVILPSSSSVVLEIAIIDLGFTNFSPSGTGLCSIKFLFCFVIFLKCFSVRLHWNHIYLLLYSP